MASDEVLQLVVAKIEARTGGRSANEIAREVRRVASPFAIDGWLSPAQLARALEYWVVGLADKVQAFSEDMVARQNGKLSVGRLSAEIVACASGTTIERPSTACVPVVAPPYHTPTAVSRPTTASSECSSSAGMALAEALLRQARERGAASPRSMAAQTLAKQCRSVSDGAQRLELEQWRLAMRALAIAVGAPVTRNKDLDELWRDCDRGDYTRLAAELFNGPADELPPPPQSFQMMSHSSTQHKVELVRAFGFGPPTALASDGSCLVYAAGHNLVLDNGERQVLLPRQTTITALCAADGLIVAADRGGVTLWRTTELSTHQLLGAGLFEEQGGAIALALGKTKLLAAADNVVYIFECERGELIAEEAISNVHAVAAQGDSFVTVGHGHVNFWFEGESLRPKPGRFSGKSTQRVAAFGTVTWAPRQDACATRVTLVGGVDNGRLYAFRDGVCHTSYLCHEGSQISALLCLDDDTELRLLTAGVEGKIKLWIGSDLVLAFEYTLGPTSFVVALCVAPYRMQDQQVTHVCAGTRRGSVVAIDLSLEADKAKRKSRVLSRLAGGHLGTVLAVAAHPIKARVFATTGDDRRVVVWNLDCDETVARLETAGTALCYDDRPPDEFSLSVCEALVVGCADGEVIFFDPDSLKFKKRFTASKTAAISALLLCEAGLIVGTAAGELAVFAANRVRSSRPLRGHLGPIAKIDIGLSRDRQLVLCSQDAARHTLHWIVDGADSRRVNDSDDMDDVKWRTQTVLASSPKLKAVAKAHRSDTLFAVVDQTGGLELAHAPSPPRACHRLAVGHPSAPAKLVFLADDGHIVTLGSNDKTVFVFKVCHSEPNLGASTALSSPGRDEDCLDKSHFHRRQEDNGGEEDVALIIGDTDGTIAASPLSRPSPPTKSCTATLPVHRSALPNTETPRAGTATASCGASEYSWPF